MLKRFYNLHPSGIKSPAWASESYLTREEAARVADNADITTIELDLSDEEFVRLMASGDGFDRYAVIIELLSLRSLAESVPIVPAADSVTVGDLNSNARGTGARKSAGKPDWSQLPLWVIEPIRKAWWSTRAMENRDGGVETVLDLMAQWQRGNNVALDIAAALLLEVSSYPEGRDAGPFPIRGFLPTVAVLEFGAKKYAKGNWAKGMQWSTCYTCAISHLTKHLAGEANDEESGLSHLGHAMCNLVFLIGYRDLFPEGDDRLPEFRPGGVKVDLRHD
jgi:hypothetical protein